MLWAVMETEGERDRGLGGGGRRVSFSIYENAGHIAPPPLGSINARRLTRWRCDGPAAMFILENETWLN